MRLGLTMRKILIQGNQEINNVGGKRCLHYNYGVKLHSTLRPRRESACWVDFLVCPRRYLAMLPSHVRANLFAGD